MLSSTSTNNFISASNIKIITINTTEKIVVKFLQDFILTTLETNNISIDNNTYITYKFIENINLYEIYVVNSLVDNLIIAPEVLKEFYIKNNNINSIDLFILKDFFVIYKDKQLYSFKAFETLSKNEDIISYVIQTYKLHLDNIYNIDDKTFNHLKDLYSKNKSNCNNSSFYKVKNNNNFTYFTIFTLFCIMIFTSFLYFSYTNTTHNTNLNKLKEKYKQLIENNNENSKIVTYEKISLKLIEIFKYIKIENITSNKINYEKRTIQLELLHKDKNKLLNFLTIYNQEIIIENIQLLKEQNIYKMVIKIGI